jgi:DNA processing protein
MSIELGRNETYAWLALLRAPGLGASGIREQINRYGNASTALAQSRLAPGLAEPARAWLVAPDEALLESDLEWLTAANHHLIVWRSEDYPILLCNVQNPPAALFVVGDPSVLWAPQIAIVGARNASAGGIANARSFARALALSGNVITSGLAEGIDGAAHAATLDAGGKTIAVLGTGPDVVYPRRHEVLAEKIIANGALISEFPPGTPGKPEHFPRRNRIIAGLSLGTLVIEASLNSGSLITARLAAEQGKEVFALPGPIHNPLARGCHKLIRDGAKLVETAEEVIEELRGMSGLLADGLRNRLDAIDSANATPMTSEHASDPEYIRLLAVLDQTPAALDELVERADLSAGALSSMLLVLELEGVVFTENGRYARR